MNERFLTRAEATVEQHRSTRMNSQNVQKCWRHTALLPYVGFWQLTCALMYVLLIEASLMNCSLMIWTSLNAGFDYFAYLFLLMGGKKKPPTTNNALSEPCHFSRRVNSSHFLPPRYVSQQYSCRSSPMDMHKHVSLVSPTYLPVSSGCFFF